jgi:hypothetical protein
MQTNIGLKDANDKTDARFIAKQAAMGVLPRSFIYPRDLLRFDHGTSHKGAERFSGPSRRTEPQVCMHTPHRRAAAPAIYWSRMGEMCLRTPAGSGTRTRWVTERNAFAFQFITIAIKPGSNGTSRRSVMAGG